MLPKTLTKGKVAKAVEKAPAVADVLRKLAGKVARGVDYVSILRSLAEFRAKHEPAPLPKKSSQVKTRKIVSWITPRKVGERPDVASIAEERARRLREWMSARGVYPTDEALALSSGAYSEFDDFTNLMKVIEHIWLGGGEKARRLLGVHGSATGVTAEVKIDGAVLTFEDLRLDQNKLDSRFKRRH